MKILIAIVLLLTIPQALGAWGVSEKSVKKWDAEKLCKKLGELEVRNDYKAVAIVSKEIADRENLAYSDCRYLADTEFQKEVDEKAELRGGSYSYYYTTEATEVRSKMLKVYGSEFYNNLYLHACKNKDYEPDKGELAANMAAFAVATPHNREKRIGQEVAKEVMPNGMGFWSAIVAARMLYPDICNDENATKFKLVVENMIEYLSKEPLKLTQQNLEIEVATGDSFDQIIERIGEPVLTEKLGAIAAVHFCRTSDSDTNGDDFLALYFLNDSLLYQHRYKGPDKIGDCAEFAGQGTYEIPEAIKSIVGSSSE